MKTSRSRCHSRRIRLSQEPAPVDANSINPSEGLSVWASALRATRRADMDVKRKPRVGIDLTGVWRPSTGIFAYAVQLTRELLSIDDENSYTLFFSGQIHPEFHGLRDKFRAVVIRCREEVLGKQIFLAALCHTCGLDLIHFPAFPPPVACFRPFVWTLHDATPWLHPETMDWKGRLYFRSVGPWSSRSSEAIIAVSNSAKRDIVDALQVPEDKMEVIYEGVDGAFRRLADEALMNSVRVRYHLPQRFILAVGTIEPRKNLPFLVEAHRRLCEANQEEVGLVVAGRMGWNQASLLPVAEGRGKIVFTGFIPQRELVALYNLAEVFVLPSIYEGFGFPPLEAMASGCPVIVSNRGSLPEIVGDAAVLIDPENVDSLLEALQSVLRTPSLRAILVEKGFARVRQFSWRTAAVRTLELYERIILRTPKRHTVFDRLN